MTEEQFLFQKVQDWADHSITIMVFKPIHAPWYRCHKEKDYASGCLHHHASVFCGFLKVWPLNPKTGLCGGSILVIVWVHSFVTVLTGSLIALELIIGCHFGYSIHFSDDFPISFQDLDTI